MWVIAVIITNKKLNLDAKKTMKRLRISIKVQIFLMHNKFIKKI